MFSIVIPLFNKSTYILRALTSVRNQTFTRYEVIVIDDGSTDDSLNMVSAYFGESVTLIRQANQGVSAARNAGIAFAKFDYIAFLDADDYWDPMYLATMQKGIQDFPEAGIWGTSYAFDSNMLVSKQGGFKLMPDYFEKAIYNTLFFTSAVVLNKAFFVHNEGFKPYLKRGEDLDVWFRAVAFFGHGAYCEDRLVFYEKGDAQSATRTDLPVQNALVGHVSKEAYLKHISFFKPELSVQFNRFKIQYVLFTAYPYLKESSNHLEIKGIFSNLDQSYPLISFWYKLPYAFLQWFFLGKKRSHLFRNYMKFCFRHIYHIQ